MSGIEKHSQASKNISDISSRGRECENHVEQALKTAKIKILFRNWKTPFGEVDIVCRPRIQSPHANWILIEVKSLRDSQYVGDRVSYGQKYRLRRVFLWLSEKWGTGASYLALVGPNGKIVWIPDFLD